MMIIYCDIQSYSAFDGHHNTYKEWSKNGHTSKNGHIVTIIASLFVFVVMSSQEGIGWALAAFGDQ